MFSVDELDSPDNFSEMVEPSESSPSFLGTLSELEDHGEHGLSRQTSPSALVISVLEGF